MLTKAFGLVRSLLGLATVRPGRSRSARTQGDVPTPRPGKVRAAQGPLDVLPGRAASPADARLVAGTVELLGLDGIRESLGSHWNDVALRAAGVVESCIASLMTDADHFARRSDTQFLLYFHGLDVAAAREKSSQIAAAIQAELVRELVGVADDILVDHFVGEVSRDITMQSDEQAGNALVAELGRIRREAEIASSKARNATLAPFKIQFSPVWHRGKGTIILNRTLSDSNFNGPSVLEPQSSINPYQPPVPSAELDRKVLTRSISSLHQSVRAGRRAAVLVSLDFRNCQSEGEFKAYVALLELVPAAYRRLLFVELSHAPNAAGVDEIERITRTLAAHVKGVAMELSAEDARTALLANTGLWGLTLNLARVNPVEKEFRLKRFAATAIAGGMIPLASNVRSVGLALASVEAGFTLIDGPAIRPTSLVLQPPSHYLPSSLRKLGKSSRPGRF